MKPFTSFVLIPGLVGSYLPCFASSIFQHLNMPTPAGLQNAITWDQSSLFVNGERAMMYSGEFHPFRLPVPSLYLDVFQKIRAMGLNVVSFYVDWALLEGKPGRFRAKDIFDLEPFLEAAKKAGVYLLARPGPYINAEVSGGGFPGWLQRINGLLRTDKGEFLNMTDNYMANVCSIIAKHQITNGGAVILFQPENEYSSGSGVPFPNGKYFQYIIDQARKAGIVVPTINNDVGPSGNYAPGSGTGEVDIYGHDSYPLGLDCRDPKWPPNALVTDYRQRHLQQSPSTPYSIVEFQGGSYDGWGGSGMEKCADFLNHEFERVFNKNNLAAGVTIFNIYMIFGGTNWGNLGHPGGYTSYDYGASIRESRAIDREKYSEVKLQGQFLRVSPGYLVSTPGNMSTTAYSDKQDITITPLLGNGTGNFFVARHTDYASTASTSYRLHLPTSGGNLTIPRFGDALSLHGRDSKIHVTDYRLGRHRLLYSTAEILTWKRSRLSTVLILYGGPDESHEFAVTSDGGVRLELLEGRQLSSHAIEGPAVVVSWKTSPDRQVVRIGSLDVYMIDRNSAYKHWFPVLPKKGSAYGSSVMNPDMVIVNGGYLVRSAEVRENSLWLQADFNGSTSMEIIQPPEGASKLRINGRKVPFESSALGNWIAQVEAKIPAMTVPSLAALDWYRIDALPEIKAGYDDAAWPLANHTTTNNSFAPLLTPVSLYGSDYGFHTGTLLFRGHFQARGDEVQLELKTAGGSAFANSVWLNQSFLGSFKNAGAASSDEATFGLAELQGGESYVLTVVVDGMGLDENLIPGWDSMKSPRGILNYSLHSATGQTTDVRWKLTGNLGGEDYIDTFRGPLNEGGLFFERQGLHLPSPPLDRFERGSPLDGFRGPGIVFYTARLLLDLPAEEYDVPLYLVLDDDDDDDDGDSRGGDFRALVYVNGFQFGKMATNIGPQKEFFVPEGIWHYRGPNWIGIALWALDGAVTKMPKLRLCAGPSVLSGRDTVQPVDGPAYRPRKNAY